MFIAICKVSVRINDVTVTFKHGVTAVNYVNIETRRESTDCLENTVPKKRICIRNLLVDFSENRTVLFSTNVVEDLVATCDRLVVSRISIDSDSSYTRRCLYLCCKQRQVIAVYDLVV